MAKQNLIDLLKADPKLTHIHEVSPGRHFVEVPIDALKTHTDVLKRARADDPENVDLLKSSFGHTGDGPLYHPVVFPEKQADGSVQLFIVDGHQRIRAAKSKGDKRMIVQVITIWISISEAFEASISANFARYRVDEKDVFSILTTGHVGKDRLIYLTGFSESKIDRLILISQHPMLVPLVSEKLVGPSTMVKLIKACKSNEKKLEALVNAMDAMRLDAEGKARHWRNVIRTNKHIKYERRDRDKRDPKTFFKNVAWDAWEDALMEDVQSERFTKRDDGTYLLSPEARGEAKCVNIRVGDENEWEQCIAIFGLSGVKRSEVDPDQLKTQILDNWDELGERLQGVYEEIAATKKPQSQRRDKAASRRTRSASASPKKQKPNMTIVSSDEDE